MFMQFKLQGVLESSELADLLVTIAQSVLPAVTDINMHIHLLRNRLAPAGRP